MPISPQLMQLLQARGIVPQAPAPMSADDLDQPVPQIVAPQMRPGQVTPTASLDFGSKLAQSGLTLPPQGGTPPPVPDPAAGFKKATAAIGIPADAGQAATRWQPTGEPAKPPVPPPVFVQPEQTAQPVARSTMLLPSGGGGGVRPAQDASTIGPVERAELQNARNEVRSAYDELVGTPVRSTMPGVEPERYGGVAGANEAKADASKYLSAMAGVEAARGQLAENERTRKMQEQEAEYARLREDAASSPLKYDRRSFGARAAGAIFMALNAFGNAIQRRPDAPNLAKEIIDQSIERDYQDQLQAKKGKSEKAEAAGDLLSRMRARFGDERAAESGFRAMRWQEYAANAEGMAQRAQSPILVAQAKLLRAQADVETAKLDIDTHKWTPAGAVGGTNEAELYKKYADAWLHGDQKVPLQSFSEWQQSRGGVGHGASAQESGSAAQKTQEQLRAYDNVLDKAREVEAMVRLGGKLSPSETARGRALVSELVNEIPRAQLGTTRAPAEKEQELVKQGLPKDPNSFQFTGSDLAKIQQTIRSLEAEKSRLAGGSGAPPASAAQLGATPLGGK